MNRYLKRTVNPQVDLDWKPSSRREIYGDDAGQSSQDATGEEWELLRSLVGSQIAVAEPMEVDSADGEEAVEQDKVVDFRLIGSGVRSIQLVEDGWEATRRCVLCLGHLHCLTMIECCRSRILRRRQESDEDEQLHVQSTATPSWPSTRSTMQVSPLPSWKLQTDQSTSLDQAKSQPWSSEQQQVRRLKRPLSCCSGPKLFQAKVAARGRDCRGGIRYSKSSIPPTPS